MNNATNLAGALALALLAMPTVSAQGIISEVVGDECDDVVARIKEEYCLVKGLAYATAQAADDLLDGDEVYDVIDEWEDKVEVCWEDYWNDLLLGPPPECPYDDTPPLL